MKKGYLYLLPATCILGIFQFYPILRALMMGFYVKFDYLTERVEEIGIDHFVQVMQDPDFLFAIRNTIVYACFSTPIGIGLALLLALILHENTRLKSVFQSIYFLPFVTSTTAITVVFRWMLNKDYGIVNAILTTFGMPKVAWLTEPSMTIPILVVMSIWRGLGYKMIILLAALQNVDSRQELAGKMDGASKWNRVRYLVIPSMKPVLFFLFVVSMISDLKLFDEVNILYGGKSGPMQSGLTMVYYIFDKFYRHWEFARASAAAVILFGCILLLTGLQYLVWGRKKDEA